MKDSHYEIFREGVRGILPGHTSVRLLPGVLQSSPVHPSEHTHLMSSEQMPFVQGGSQTVCREVCAYTYVYICIETHSAKKIPTKLITYHVISTLTANFQKNVGCRDT